MKCICGGNINKNEGVLHCLKCGAIWTEESLDAEFEAEAIMNEL